MKKERIGGRELTEMIKELADSKKAENIACMNPSESSGVADWFMICQGDNTAHNRAIADAIIDGLRRENVSPWHTEGLEDGRWIVIDYSDVVVHVMLPETRKRYSLEELWSGKAKKKFDGELQ
jgi:ribosome-associated protein